MIVVSLEHHEMKLTINTCRHVCGGVYFKFHVHDDSFLWRSYPPSRQEVLMKCIAILISKSIVIQTSLKLPIGIINIRNSQMDRQHNDKIKMNKRTNNDLQNITQKTKNRSTHTH